MYVKLQALGDSYLCICHMKGTDSLYQQSGYAFEPHTEQADFAFRRVIRLASFSLNLTHNAHEGLPAIRLAVRHI